MIGIGIVGLPNVGKSTLFNAITKAGAAEAANYPFCTIEPNVGMVTVPDERLNALAQIINPERIVPATVEFVDIAGLVKGASKGEGLGNKFLSNIRATSAICQVVRCFDDENVIHVSGQVDPISDIEVINTELIFADIETIEKAIEKHEKLARNKIKESVELMAVLPKVKKHLEEFKLLKTLDLTDEEKQVLKNYQLLTLKPMIFAANVATYFTAGVKEVRAWTIRIGDTAPKAAGEIHTDFEKGFIRAKVVSYDDFIKYSGWKGSQENGVLRLEGKEYIVHDGDLMEFLFNV